MLDGDSGCLLSNASGWYPDLVRPQCSPHIFLEDEGKIPFIYSNRSSSNIQEPWILLGDIYIDLRFCLSFHYFGNRPMAQLVDAFGLEPKFWEFESPWVDKYTPLAELEYALD